MTTREQYPDLMLLEDMDAAFAGVLIEHPTGRRRAVYDTSRCLNVLIERDEMEPDDAADYFDTHVVDRCGAHGPVFLDCRYA